MKYLINSFPFLFFLLPLACTNGPQSELHWRNLANPEVTKVKVEAKKSMNSASEAFVGEAESGLKILGVEHELEPKGFDVIFTKMKFFLHSIYQDQNAPYPGQITNMISCPEKFRPRSLPSREDPGIKGEGFLLLANGREVFGACDVSSAQFQAAYLLIECKAQHVAYEIKMFLPAGAEREDELKRIYERFTCK